MAKYPGLFRRNSTWYVRKRVPQDISDLYKAQSVKRSLKTGDLSEAKKHYHVYMLQIESEFDQKRKERNHLHQADQLSNFSEAGILGLAFDWYRDVEQRVNDAEAKINKTYSEEDVRDSYIDAKQTKQAYHDALLKNDYEIILPAAQAWLHKKNISFDVKSQAFHLFCKHLLQAIMFWYDKDIQEYEGKTITRTYPSLFEPLIPQKSYQQPIQEQPVLLTELLEKFMNQTERENISDKSNTLYRSIVKRLNEFAGKELYTNEVSRRFLEEYRDALREFPSRAHIIFKNKTFHEILELSKGMDVERMQIKSINTHIHSLHALFEYAELNEYIKKNPVKKLALHDYESDKNKRHPWPHDKLGEIFTMPLFQPNKPSPIPASKYDHAIYWACLISLWAGLRKKEICQLQTGDLKSENGILHLDIVERPEFNAKLKTPYSARKIPLHNELIMCGLPDLFEKQKSANELWLFPELATNSKNGYGHYLGKRFSALVNKHNIAQDKCSFHSFRHNYRDAFREAEIDRDIAHALGGWSTSDKKTVADSYGSGYALAKLNENLQKIAYKGLDLSHLHIKATK